MILAVLSLIIVRCPIFVLMRQVTFSNKLSYVIYFKLDPAGDKTFGPDCIPG